MSREQLRAFLILLMCSDPWPVDELGNHEIIINFADEEAQRHGFIDWIDAYHKL